MKSGPEGVDFRYDIRGNRMDGQSVKCVNILLGRIK